MFEVIIIGGGPAGLNAAVVLGRCKRKIIVFDSGQYRNQSSKGMHNYLTRDGISPDAFLKIAREEVRSLGVVIENKRIIKATKESHELFEITDENNVRYKTRMLLIATGLKDELPSIPGIDDYYGITVHHCPYCDGWESKDKKICLYSKTSNGVGMAVALKTWSSQITLLTDGPHPLSAADKKTLSLYDIPLINTPVKKLKGLGGKLEKIIFSNGDSVDCDVMFFKGEYKQHCLLVKDFQCRISTKGAVKTDRYQQTNIEGLYVAGDAARDMHLVVVAAAEGAKAAIAINIQLQARERPLYKKASG